MLRLPFSSYYSQGATFPLAFPVDPLSYWKHHFLFITHILLHTQAIFIPERESGEGCDEKMLKKLLSKTKSKKKKEAASSALPTLDRLHGVFISSPGCFFFLSYSRSFTFLLEFHQYCWQSWVGFWVVKLTTF
jgi:hypothetical protein